MRCYLVQGGGRKRYAATAATATEMRNTIAEETGTVKRGITISQEDIPTGKLDLLEFVNELCEELDQTPKGSV
jgi:CRISPR/Cas system CMR subunit Cmr4 (Cas7 group RAMP superfamily)